MVHVETLQETYKTLERIRSKALRVYTEGFLVVYGRDISYYKNWDEVIANHPSLSPEDNTFGTKPGYIDIVKEQFMQVPQRPAKHKATLRGFRLHDGNGKLVLIASNTKSKKVEF